MTALNWAKANQSNPDPATVRRTQIDDQLSDRELEAFKKKISDIINAPPPKRPRRKLAEVFKARKCRPSSIAERISFVLESGKTDADQFFHETALEILVHADRYGDCSAALALVLAMPSRQRQQRLVRWFLSCSPIGILLPERRVRLLKEGSKAYRTFNLKLAAQNPFYQMPAPPA